MITPLAYADSLRIGNVDFVSPNEVKVQIDIEAPDNIALNAGFPSPFPRVGSYLLISGETGFLVGQVEWITIERSQFPQRKGLQDFGVIDLPFPMRKMSLTPLGVLRVENSERESKFSFSRGIDIFPTVGDPVLLPNQKQLKSIVESGSNRRVRIGTSPSAANAVVMIDPDRLFGRHLAILGNTGSGKSCSVAGLIRWSIEAAKKSANEEIKVNSRFIILDPNGEYTQTFKDMKKNVRIFAVEANDELGIKQLQVPLWFWNTNEWCAFTQASSKTQRPTLIQALRSVRAGREPIIKNPSRDRRGYLRLCIQMLSTEFSEGNPSRKGYATGFRNRLKAWEAGLQNNVDFSDEEKNATTELLAAIDNFFNSNRESGPRKEEFPLYDQPSCNQLMEAFNRTFEAFGGSSRESLLLDADLPRPFSIDSLLISIEAYAELMKTSEHVNTMLMRIRTLLSDSRLKTITDCTDELTLDKWLSDYICTQDSRDGAITIIDLSLVPSEVVHIITSVIARMILESLQRYRRLNRGKTLPTTLVMEEAHTFIRRYSDENEDTQTYSMCTKVFEKIAREGRKFGLGLVLSSQRPSELSPTVLSQCNTFLLHRINNDRDQELVNKLVPDNLRGLLRELPTLPSQRAILLGWASELPVTVQMDYLPENQRPQSNDPDYWHTWTTIDSQQNVGWGAVVQDWQDNHSLLIEDEIDSPEEESVENKTLDDEDEDIPF